MPARAEFRDRDAVEVEILDALVGRAEDGMTVLELRSHVDADIDRIETALTTLKEEGLIQVEEADERVCLYPDDRVVPDPGENPEEDLGLLDTIRRAIFGS
jgi:ribosome assembly protein YihI (activator of Der GTPase)